MSAGFGIGFFSSLRPLPESAAVPAIAPPSIGRRTGLETGCWLGGRLAITAALEALAAALSDGGRCSKCGSSSSGGP